MGSERTAGEGGWPLVSILIPAHNHERFVMRCLDSVLEDPYPAKELVIVDDGSIDGTPSKIAQWIARHENMPHESSLPIIYRRRENRGVAATLNELASLARGDFLKLGASDDYLLPGGLEAQVRYLQAQPRKWAVVGDSVVVDCYGNQVHDSGMRGLHHADKRQYATDEGIRRAVIRHWAIGGPVALLRRSVPGAISGWTEELRIDDWDFFLRLVARDALGFIDLPVCAYRLHDANLSKTRHVATRVANLAESRRVALRRVELFDGPDRQLLKAQAHYIGAKIAFLQRRPLRLAWRMAACLALRGLSKLRLPTAHPAVERA